MNATLRIDYYQNIRGRVLGRDIVLARRSGAVWYVDAMTADKARTTRVSLSFGVDLLEK